MTDECVALGTEGGERMCNRAQVDPRCSLSLESLTSMFGPAMARLYRSRDRAHPLSMRGLQILVLHDPLRRLLRFRCLCRLWPAHPRMRSNSTNTDFPRMTPLPMGKAPPSMRGRVPMCRGRPCMAIPCRGKGHPFMVLRFPNSMFTKNSRVRQRLCMRRRLFKIRQRVRFLQRQGEEQNALPCL